MKSQDRKLVILYSGFRISVSADEYFFYDALNTLTRLGYVPVGEMINAQFHMVKDGYIYV